MQYRKLHPIIINKQLLYYLKFHWQTIRYRKQNNVPIIFVGRSKMHTWQPYSSWKKGAKSSPSLVHSINITIFFKKKRFNSWVSIGRTNKHSIFMYYILIIFILYIGRFLTYYELKSCMIYEIAYELNALSNTWTLSAQDRLTSN